MDDKFEQHIKPEIFSGQDISILDCIYEQTGLSKQKIKLSMKNGCVWLESERGISRCRRAKKKLQPGNQVHIYYDKNIQQIKPPVATLIADEGDYSIWNKPCGMYSQGTKWGDHCTVYRWAEEHLLPQRSAFLVHRLDRAANGLIVIAHKKKVAALFSMMFEKHQVYKKYKATVEGEMQNIPLPYKINLQIDGKPAESEILAVLVNRQRKTSDVEVTIRTGRKHQIRKHLEALGYPILGDRLYGNKREDIDLQLRSSVLEFVCPVTNKLKRYEI